MKRDKKHRVWRETLTIITLTLICLAIILLGQQIDSRLTTLYGRITELEEQNHDLRKENARLRRLNSALTHDLAHCPIKTRRKWSYKLPEVNE